MKDFEGEWRVAVEYMNSHLNHDVYRVKRPFNQTTIRTVLIMASVSVLMPVVAAEKPRSTPAAATLADPTSEPALEVKKGLVFTGSSEKPATLANVMEALRERYPEVNIAIAPALHEVKIADLKLRTRSIWEDIEAVRVASNDKFEWQGPGSPVFSGRANSPSPSMFAASPPTPTQASGNSGLFVLRMPSLSPENMRDLEAFNIGGYLQWLVEKGLIEGGAREATPELRQKLQAEASSDGILQVREIISRTLASLRQGAGDAENQLDFQFHPGANLLIVIGDRSALEVAAKVVGALPGAAQHNPYGAMGMGGSVGGPGLFPQANRLGGSLPGTPGSWTGAGAPPPGTVANPAVPGSPALNQVLPQPAKP
jgi:hypothetical protein